MDAHKVAHGAVRGACAEGGPSISGQGEAMLLMVEEPEDLFGSNEIVLRSINELQTVAPCTTAFRIGDGVPIHFSKVSLQSHASVQTCSS